MKKKVFLSIVLIVTILFAGIVYATEESTAVSAESTEAETTEAVTTEEKEDVEETFTTEIAGKDEAELISGTYFMSEDLVNTVVNGNVFGAGSDLTVSDAEIYGDLYIVGSDITLVNVNVYGNILIAGKDISVSEAIITGNVFVAGDSLEFAGISQDIFAVAQVITLTENCTVVREVYAMAGSIYLDGADIGSNAYLTADTLSVDENVTIGDTLNYSATSVSISEDSSIGTVNYNDLTESTSSSSNWKSALYSIVTITIKAIFILGFIFLFAKGFIEKQKTENVTKYIATSTLKGLGWAVVIPIVAVILLFTGLAYGLSLGVLAIYMLLFWASTSIVAVTITANVAKDEENIWRFYGHSILVVIAIAVLRQIPIIKWIVTVVVGLAGMGIFMNMFKREKKADNVKDEKADKKEKTDKKDKKEKNTNKEEKPAKEKKTKTEKKED